MIILRQKNYSFGRFFEGFGNDKFNPQRTAKKAAEDINPALLEEAKKYRKLSTRELSTSIEKYKPTGVYKSGKKVPKSMRLVRNKRKQIIKKIVK